MFAKKALIYRFPLMDIKFKQNFANKTKKSTAL